MLPANDNPRPIIVGVVRPDGSVILTRSIPRKPKLKVVK